MIHMSCSVYRMSDGSLLAVLVPAMYVGCSVISILKNFGNRVLVPTMYVGCSNIDSIGYLRYRRFSTRDVRGL